VADDRAVDRVVFDAADAGGDDERNAATIFTLTLSRDDLGAYRLQLDVAAAGSTRRNEHDPGPSDRGDQAKLPLYAADESGRSSPTHRAANTPLDPSSHVHPDSPADRAQPRAWRAAAGVAAAIAVFALGYRLSQAWTSAPSSKPTASAVAAPDTTAPASTAVNCQPLQSGTPPSCGSGTSGPATLAGLPSECRNLLDTAAAALGVDSTTWAQNALNDSAASSTPVDDTVHDRLIAALTSEVAANHGDLDLVANIRALDAAVAAASKRPCSSPPP
jgi:hypothetical protein